MALQDAGITRQSIRGSDTGVYIGKYDALDLDPGAENNANNLAWNNVLIHQHSECCPEAET